MKIQIGGLKLKNPSKRGFEAVYDMINSESGRLNLLTYKSLKGFMITLDVNENDSEYLTLNGNKFTKPVTSFILKFAIITPNNDETLPNYKEREKSSESKDSYFEEAKLQQHIWKNSIVGGRPEICPPVANFSLFDNDNSKRLLQFLQLKTSGTSKEIFDYLLTCVNDNVTNEIGIIVMPSINRSTTFGDFINLPNRKNFYGKILDDNDKNKAKACISAQIIRLFINIGVIHFDLHSGNALIYLTPENEIKCLLIDFGRASNIMIDTPDDYFKTTEKLLMKGMKEDFFNSLFQIQDKKEKKNFILDVLNNIAYIDFKKNQEMFNYTDKNRFQMDWYRDYPKETSVPEYAFEILKNSIVVEGTKITPDTIKNYERQGVLINFNKGISTFIVPFPGVQTSTTEICGDDMSGKGCSIMGGRKTKTYKKHKKQLKTRRIKKMKNIH